MARLVIVCTLALVACISAVAVPEKSAPSANGFQPDPNFVDDSHESCNNHGVLVDNTCACEPGFTGAHCETVIIRSKFVNHMKQPITNCTVTVYDSNDISVLQNPLATGACDENGQFTIEVPHRHKYILSALNSKGSEGRQYYAVPESKELRQYRNRNRRSHESDWQNAPLLTPEYLLAEQWYAHIFWGYDHTDATCDLDMLVRGPYQGGCVAQMKKNRYQCKVLNSFPVTDHYITPTVYDQSCNNAEYGYEAYYIYEIGQNQNFELFAYNVKYLDPWGYQNFRWNTPSNGVFAFAVIYKAGVDGAATLVASADLTQAAQSSLRPGLYWHIFSLTINTPPANIHEELPGDGVVTVRNTVSCSPLAMVYNDNIQAWENKMDPYYRGYFCPKKPT